MTGRALRELLGDDAAPPRMWAEIPPETVDPGTVIPTQWPHYVPCRVCQHRLGRPVEGGDPAPHLIQWRGALYVWDGHNRIAGCLRAGRRAISVRVWRL